MLTIFPNQVTVTLAGTINISGFVDGTFIELQKEVTPYTYKSSLDGETSRTFRDDRNWKATIFLAQSSPSNDVLSALHGVDIATQLGKVPLFIKDHSGSTVFFSTDAWIENYPTLAMSKNVEARAWVFHCSNCTVIAGGNDGSGSNKITDVFSILPTIKSVLGA